MIYLGNILKEILYACLNLYKNIYNFGIFKMNCSIDEMRSHLILYNFSLIQIE